jgi:2-polyprenyl-6-hydroxyphenyl methylase/3-demethylubiquinone-9 3-methyltransferase
MENASKLGKPDKGLLWISIYAKGPNYPKDLQLKERFNNASWINKQATVLRFLLRRWRNERRNGKKIPDWFWHGRGMNAYHDAIDWFGGLPYEVASVDEVTAFLAERGWTPERIEEAVEGGCSTYLFRN